MSELETMSGGDDMSQLLIAIRAGAPSEGDRPLSQSQAATRAGLSQSKITRAETGRFPLSVRDAERYARALQATDEQVSRLVELAREHEARNRPARHQLIESPHVVQRRIADLLREHRTLQAWVPDVLPGILQSEDYTRALIGFEPEPRWWKPRREQQLILRDLNRQVHLIVGEAALRTGVGSAPLMARELDHLARSVEHPPVRLGVIPLDVVLPVAPPRGLYLYGDAVVSQATEFGTTFVADPKLVERHLGLFEHLADSALHGDDAREVIRRAAVNWRGHADARR